MNIDWDRPLVPQVQYAFNEKKHGTTIPDILREMARRIDLLQQGLDSQHEAPHPTRPGNPQGDPES